MKKKTVNVRVYEDSWKRIKIMGIKRDLNGMDMVDLLVRSKEITT